VAARAESGAFTVEHFAEWASMLVLDTEEPWEPEDWQLEVVGDIFAGFREVWMITPEENAKTTTMAGLALYHCDYTRSPWVPIGAASRDQAEILHTQAAGFVRRSPGMSKRFRVFDGYRAIRSLRNPGPGIRVYAADKVTGDGVIPTLCIVDEGHRHKDLGLYRTWKGKLRKRGGAGQIVMISTAGEPGGDFEETRDKIRNQAETRTRKGPAYMRAEAPNIVMHEWKVPDADSARDLQLVAEANPLAAITAKTLAEKLASPTLDFGEDWLRLTCNIPARSSRAAISDQEWDDAETEDRIPEGEPIMAGLDVAWKWDCTAIVPLWMPREDLRLLGDPAILRPPRDGTMLNPHEIEDAFQALHERNPIQRVVMDREKGEQLASWLEEELGVEIVERPRSNAAAAEDYERFMEALRQGWLKHTGDGELRRHAMNAVVRLLPADKRRFDRPVGSRGNAKEQDRRVIDALDAASMVHTVAEAEFTAVEVMPLVVLVPR
jgi:phage terminase large subunit-like protein